MCFSRIKCTFAARQDFSNLYSGFHLDCTIHHLPTMKITTWFDEIFVCRLKSLQSENLQVYLFSPSDKTYLQRKELQRGIMAREMLKVGFSCFRKQDSNTKCKYSSTAMQKTLSHTYKLFTFFRCLW